MYLLYKFVFILVILGNVSKLSAFPVKNRNVVFSEAAEKTEMSGDGGHKEAVTLDPKVARHLLLVFGLIAVTILTIVLVLKKLWEKYSEWKDCKESLKRPTKVAPFEEVSVAQKVFKAKTAKKVFSPPRDIFDDV